MEREFKKELLLLLANDFIEATDVEISDRTDYDDFIYAYSSMNTKLDLKFKYYIAVTINFVKVMINISVYSNNIYSYDLKGKEKLYIENLYQITNNRNKNLKEYKENKNELEFDNIKDIVNEISNAINRSLIKIKY